MNKKVHDEICEIVIKSVIGWSIYYKNKDKSSTLLTPFLLFQFIERVLVPIIPNLRTKLVSVRNKSQMLILVLRYPYHVMDGFCQLWFTTTINNPFIIDKIKTF